MTYTMKFGTNATSGAQQMATGAVLIQTYATVLAIQPSLAPLADLGIPADQHLSEARTHMQVWLDATDPTNGLKARMETLIDNIVQWNATFQAYWAGSDGFDANVAILTNPASTAAQTQAALNSIAGKLSLLQSPIQGYYNSADTLNGLFKSFTANINQDHADFDSDVDAFAKQNSAESTKLAELKAQIAGVNAQIASDAAIIAASCVALVGTAAAMGYCAYTGVEFAEGVAPVLLTVGLGVIGTSLFEIVSRSGEVHHLAEQKGDLQAEYDQIQAAVVAATQLSSNIAGLATGANGAALGCSQIATNWSALINDLSNVINDCKQGYSTAQNVIAWLNLAKSDWAKTGGDCQVLKDLGLKVTGVQAGQATMSIDQVVASINAAGTQRITDQALSALPTHEQIVRAAA